MKKIPACLILPAVFGALRWVAWYIVLLPHRPHRFTVLSSRGSTQFYTAVHTAHYRYGHIIFVCTSRRDQKGADFFRRCSLVPGTYNIPGTLVQVLENRVVLTVINCRPPDRSYTGQPLLDRARRAQCRRSDSSACAVSVRGPNTMGKPGHVGVRVRSSRHRQARNISKICG